MSERLSLMVILFAIILLVIVLYLLRKGRIPVKYALIWIFAVCLIFIASIIPNFMEFIATFLGFELSSNMILTFFIAILLFLTLILTVMAAGQKKKTTLLIQEVSLLKKELEDRKWNIY